MIMKLFQKRERYYKQKKLSKFRETINIYLGIEVLLGECRKYNNVQFLLRNRKLYYLQQYILPLY